MSVKRMIVRLTHSHTMTPFDAPGKQAFWKHCGKRRNCSLRAISPFPSAFSSRLDNFLPFSSNLKLSSANSLSLEESKICRLVMGYGLGGKLSFNPFPNKPWFLRVCSTSLSKTRWEKEKLLVTSNFSFSHSVFQPFGELSAIFIKFEIVVCKFF